MTNFATAQQAIVNGDQLSVPAVAVGDDFYRLELRLINTGPIALQIKLGEQIFDVSGENIAHFLRAWKIIARSEASVALRHSTRTVSRSGASRKETFTRHGDKLWHITKHPITSLIVDRQIV